ncbi:MAG: aminotransferase class V-fold PLP-dependent enzyme [Kiritimatiellia bacterium]
MTTTPLPLKAPFPALQQQIKGNRLVWLDSASTTLKPLPVIEAVQHYYTTCSANVHRAVHTLGENATAAFEASRQTVRDFLHAKSTSEIIFTAGTTDSINLLATSLSRGILKPGDAVLITTLEHHANIVPWQMLRDYHGIELRVAPITPEGDIDLDRFRAACTPNVKLAAFIAVSNAIGTILPIREMIQIAREAGTWTLVDAAQAAATMPIDVQALECDFLVCSGHKIFGPTGIGVLYGREKLLEILPPARTGGDMIKSVTFEKTVFNDLPAKFEAGTPNIAGAIGLDAAIRFVKNVGFESIMQHEANLLQYARNQLVQIPGLHLVGAPAKQASIISFTLDQVHPHDAGSLFDDDGIAVRAGHHCAQPLMQHFAVPATIRLSFSLYNDKHDIDRVTESVKRIIKVFA